MRARTGPPLPRALRKTLERLRRRFASRGAEEEGCRHRAVRDYSRWVNTPSGNGFFVSQCSRCGTEMTKPNAGGWEAKALSERH